MARLGEVPYKVAYSLLSLAALVLIAFGYGDWRAAGPPLVWDPPVWTRHLALLLMLFASIALVAAYSRGHIGAMLGHPMLVAVKTWAVAHLIANGDLATIVLSLGILAWAVYARMSMRWREPAAPVGVAGWRGDALAVAGGVALYLVLAYAFHPYVVGVPVMPA
jgi:uncharacterized membrane protein